MKKKFECLFCDSECSINEYLKNGTLEEIENLLMFWKLCPKHAKDLDIIYTKKEKNLIESTVA